MEQKTSKRPWRKLVKKLQRKRKRQKLAQQRDKDLEEAELAKLKDPLYKSWQKQQEVNERQHQLAEEKERQEQEELWLRRELLAQKQFKIDELKRQAEEDKLEAERLKQMQELQLLEEARQKKHKEMKLQAEKAAKEFDDVLNCMQEYLDNCLIKTPSRLEQSVQSRPGEKSCDFFDKTNCCRFGPGCTFNHKRPMLAKIILIKHFFQHPLLEHQEHEEYSKSDSELELSERDLRDSYDEFCEDVWPVLEEFGNILNFRTVRNVQAHLRGHVFVEYTEKRSALKAFINLQNRYYASKRLNVEFSNIRQWRTGVCGMRSIFKGLSLGRKCPKGIKCNFLHLMKNMDNKYNRPIEDPERSARIGSQSVKAVSETPITSWNFEDTIRKNQSRNWRWSESPEVELETKKTEEVLKRKTKIKQKDKRYSSDGKSDSPNLCYHKSRSNSANSIRDKHSRNSQSNNPHFNKNEKKDRLYSAEQKNISSTSKAGNKISESQRDNSSKSPQGKRYRRRSRSKSPYFRNYKYAKKSRSKSPTSRRNKNSRSNSPYSSHYKTKTNSTTTDNHYKSRGKSSRISHKRSRSKSPNLKKS